MRYRTATLMLAALLGVGVACRTHRAEPEFTGTVGQLENGDKFLLFLHTHEGRTVALDVHFPKDEFQGSVDGGSANFDVWEQCDDLAEGQKPGPLSGGCTGFEYTVPFRKGQPSPMVRDGDRWRLHGVFRVEAAGGPLQGLMAVRLAPLPDGGGH